MQEPRRAQLQPLVLAHADTWAPPERVLESHPEPAWDGSDGAWDKGGGKDTDMGGERHGDDQRNGGEMDEGIGMEMVKGMGWTWSKDGMERAKRMGWRGPKEWDEDGQRNGMEMVKGLEWTWTKDMGKRWPKEWDGKGQRNEMEMAKGIGWRWPKEWDGYGQRNWDGHGQRKGEIKLSFSKHDRFGIFH